MTPRQKAMSRYREKNREILRAKNLEYYNKNKDYFGNYRKQYAPANRDKAKGKNAVYYALKIGKLIKQLCFVCGEKAEAHHPSYALPLTVSWLCRIHHKEVH